MADPDYAPDNPIPPLPIIKEEGWEPPLLKMDTGKPLDRELSAQYTRMIYDINSLFEIKPLSPTITMFSDTDENKKLKYVYVWPLKFEVKKQFNFPKKDANLLLEFTKDYRKQSFAYLNEHIQFCEKRAIHIRFYDLQPDSDDFPIMAQFVFNANDMPSSDKLPTESTANVDNTNPVSYFLNTDTYTVFVREYDNFMKQAEHDRAASQDKKTTAVGAVTRIRSLLGNIPTLKVDGIDGALINNLIREINKAWPGYNDIYKRAMLGSYDEYIRWSYTWQDGDFWFFKTCDDYYYLHMKFPFPKNTQELKEDIIMSRTTNEEVFDHMHKYTNMLKKYKRIDGKYKQNNAIEIKIYKEDSRAPGVVCIEFKFALRPPSQAGPIKPICMRPNNDPFDSDYNTDYDCNKKEKLIESKCYSKGGFNTKKENPQKKEKNYKNILVDEDAPADLPDHRILPNN